MLGFRVLSVSICDFLSSPEQSSQSFRTPKMWVTTHEVEHSFLFWSLFNPNSLILSCNQWRHSFHLFDLQMPHIIFMNARTTGRRCCHYQYFASNFPTISYVSKSICEVTRSIRNILLYASCSSLPHVTVKLTLYTSHKTMSLQK